MLAARISCGAVIGALVLGCGDDDDTGFRPPNTTTPVGTFDGLFDDVVTGFNSPFDIGIVSKEPLEPGTIAAGDILVANYGTSEVLLADPVARGSASAFYDGTSDGLRGATAVSIPPDGHVWAAFEQGGDANSGGIAILSSTGERIAVLDGAMLPGAFANPGGICYGGNPAAGVFSRDTIWFTRANNTNGALRAITRAPRILRRPPARSRRNRAFFVVGRKKRWRFRAAPPADVDGPLRRLFIGHEWPDSGLRGSDSAGMTGRTARAAVGVAVAVRLL